MGVPNNSLGSWLPLHWPPAPHIFLSVYLWPLLTLLHLPTAWQPLQGLEKCLSWEQTMTLLLALVPGPLNPRTIMQSGTLDCDFSSVQLSFRLTWQQLVCPVHLPKPFLLSPGIFWSNSKAPTIPRSLPTLLCQVSFQCSQNTCSEMAAFLGKLCPALKGCGFGQVAVLGPGRELLGLAQILCPRSQGSTAALSVLEGIRDCSVDAQTPARPVFVLSFCNLGSGLYHSVGLPSGLWPGASTEGRPALCFGMPTPPEWSQL